MPFTLVCISASLAFAATPDDADCAAWFKGTWADAVEHRIPSGFKYEWTISAAETVDHGQIAAIEAEVAGKPEHPRRAELAMLKRLAHDPLVVTKVLWIIKDEFRVNRTSSWREQGYFDQAVRHDVAWGCGSAGQLTIVSPSRGYPKGYAYGEEPGVFGPELGSLLFGGLAYAANKTEEEPALVLSGTRWKARCAYALGAKRYTVDAEGAWDPEKKLGTIDRVQTHRDSDGSLYKMRESSGWQFDERIGRMRADETREINGRGEAERVFRWVNVEPITPADLDAVTKVPSYDGVDLARGPATFKTIVDHRGPEARYRSVVEGDVVRDIGEEEVPIGRATSWIRRAGWVVLGVILVAFICLRTRLQGRRL